MPEVVRCGLAISTNSSPMMDEEESESMTLSDEEQSCPRNHIHRQDKEEIYVLSDEEDDSEEPFPDGEVQVIKGRKPTLDYEFCELLGKGKFGSVYKCVERTTLRQFAAKLIDIKKPQERKDVENEIALMKELRHPRLLQMYQAFDEGSQMTIIMELAIGGELFSRVIDDKFVLTERVCTIFMRQICEGVEFMHSKSIVHLDMKPENILCVTPTGNRIKLIDFGLARKYSPKIPIQVMVGTPEFVAPEVINYDPITPASDMWSVGVICYILLSGLSPFMGDDDTETLSNVTNAEWDFEDECFDTISDDAKDFITNLLVKRADKRMTAAECLNHKWLKPVSPAILKVNFDHGRRLSTIKLKRFVVRRRWQKGFNTIRALLRMGSHILLDLPEENDVDEENAIDVITDALIAEQTTGQSSFDTAEKNAVTGKLEENTAEMSAKKDNAKALSDIPEETGEPVDSRKTEEDRPPNAGNGPGAFKEPNRDEIDDRVTYPLARVASTRNMQLVIVATEDQHGHGEISACSGYYSAESPMTFDWVEVTVDSPLRLDDSGVDTAGNSTGTTPDTLDDTQSDVLDNRPSSEDMLKEDGGSISSAELVSDADLPNVDEEVEALKDENAQAGTDTS
ncbi:hypothetical protein RvY_19031-2 [Ramazzottius varieornatus]|uniref:Protein kinase domain-containing protein n=1 Tax=Ramazzottius varieornatus TaxID=947166 RepID=A0A1D1WC01_RAMVA|nr:hypothetical protein RvY_19031-2 [Ramazzottius varieornatus]